MVIGNYKYGISRLPDDCMAYKDGYKYGAYKESIQDAIGATTAPSGDE